MKNKYCRKQIHYSCRGSTIHASPNQVANNSGGALGDETHEVHTPPHCLFIFNKKI
jgi:hypothetical protein